jgi:hypothetical protein
MMTKSCGYIVQYMYTKISPRVGITTIEMNVKEANTKLKQETNL